MVRIAEKALSSFLKVGCYQDCLLWFHRHSDGVYAGEMLAEISGGYMYALNTS